MIINLYGPSSVRPGALHVRALGRALAQRGHDVVFLASTVDELPQWAVTGTVAIRVPMPFGGWIESAYGTALGLSGKGSLPAVGGLVARRVMQTASHLLFAPDHRVLWCRKAMKAALSSIQDSPPDAVVSIGHPAAHLVAKKIKETWLRRVTWIADFQDPWPIFSHRYPAGRRNLRKRDGVLRTADRVIVVTSEIAKEMQLSEAEVIPFGSAFEPTKCPSRMHVPGSIAYFGNLYKGRSAITLFQGLRLAVQTLDRVYNCAPVHVTFYSSSAETECRTLVDRLGLRGFVTFAKPVPYREVYETMMRHQVLVTIQGSTYHYAISSKAYDYVMTDRPILGVVPPGSQEALFLKRFPGTFLGYTPEEIARSLVDIMLNGDDRYFRPLAARYSERAIGEELATLVEKAVE